MSPYCPGRSLVECPSPQATELRLWIQAQERAGVSRESVEARLLQQFGDQLRQAPRAEGFGLWAYLVPAGALLAGLGLVLVFLRRQTRPVPLRPAPPRRAIPRARSRARSRARAPARRGARGDVVKIYTRRGDRGETDLFARRARARRTTRASRPTARWTS